MEDQTMKADGGKMNPLLLWRDLGGPLKLVLAVLSYGATKYCAGGWKKVDPERYRAAMLRHIAAWLDGEAHDDESGLHHLGHIACNALFLIWFEMNAPLTKYRDWFTYNKPPTTTTG